MTQLLIAGTEAVLPQNFTCTVKRENPFFTKSGEYTYDVTLRMDNDVNRRLYGFLHRLNKSGAVETGRQAVLVADGRVYTRGTEVVTGWTQDTVLVQIVSAESELNWLMGQGVRLAELDLGVVTSDELTKANPASTYPDTDFCLPPIHLSMHHNLNFRYRRVTGPSRFQEIYKPVPSPFLCAMVRRVIEALGYTLKENQLEQTQFRYLFLVNTRDTLNYAEMFGGWTVKEFMEEVEKLTGCVFVCDNINRTCSVMLKTIFYQRAHVLTLHNVVDQYQVEVVDDDDREAEFSSSNVCYDMPSHRWEKLLLLPEGFADTARVTEVSVWGDSASAGLTGTPGDDKLLYDAASGRYYVVIHHETEREEYSYYAYYGSSFVTDMKELTGQILGQYYASYSRQRPDTIFEVNRFPRLKRDDSENELELKFTPAPIIPLDTRLPFIDLSSTDDYILGIKSFQQMDSDEVDEVEGVEVDDSGRDDSGPVPIVDTILDYEEPEEPEKDDIRCAFHKGFVRDDYPVDIYEFNFPNSKGAHEFEHKGYIYQKVPLVYTDAYSLKNAYGLPLPGDATESLRLDIMNTSHFQGGYTIDTRHQLTVETYDPNRADVRQMYEVEGRRYVVRDIEETVTAEGRQPRWKATLYPITISDVAADNLWVLTDGVWDDGGAWLDDGRWID